MPRGTPRLGITGTIAVVAMVGLLGAGFGMLGGRPDASPTPDWQLSSPTPQPTPPRVVHPQVTPWTDCGRPRALPESIDLQIDGTSYGADIEEMDPEFFGIPSGPMRGLPDYSGADRIEVPVDLISELWIDRGACAVAWSIDLVRGTQLLIPLDFQGNPDHDPSLAAQNRFALDLYPYADGDYILVAVFDLGTTVVRASWPIYVPSLDAPTALLLTEEGEVPVVMGCDVTLTLGTRLTQDLNPCADDVGDPPTETVLLEAGEPFEFRLESPGGSWQIDDVGGICGGLLGPSFVAEDACIARVFPGAGGTIQFRAPRTAGRWIIALSACGSSTAASQPLGRNSICGTWYASIEVRT